MNEEAFGRYMSDTDLARKGSTETATPSIAVLCDGRGRQIGRGICSVSDG